MRNACQAQVPTPEDEDHVDPRLWFYTLCQRGTVGSAGKLPLDPVINCYGEKRKRVFTPNVRGSVLYVILYVILYDGQ